MSPLEQLKSVLCGPDGTCCIAGSDEDRAIIDRALQALAAPEWQPIETAPKDKENLIWFSTLYCGRVEIGRWETDQYAKKPRPYWTSNGERIFGILAYRQGTPTHWMPLPDAPAAHNTKEDT
jgi:hypothetical protein